MADTDAQLADALTAQFVAVRGAVEALLNRVSALIAAEQIERLKLQEELSALRREIAELRALVERRP